MRIDVVVYQDKNGTKRAEVIEVKPKKETTMEQAGRSRQAQAKVILNSAKWEAANRYCRQNNLVFRIVTEDDIFHRPKKR